MAFRSHTISEAPTTHEFHRAHVNEIHLRLIDRAISCLDQGARDFKPAKLGGERESDWPAPDNEYAGILAVHARNLRHTVSDLPI
jgi:hypothetical protein